MLFSGNILELMLRQWPSSNQHWLFQKHLSVNNVSVNNVSINNVHLTDWYPVIMPPSTYFGPLSDSRKVDIFQNQALILSDLDIESTGHRTGCWVYNTVILKVFFVLIKWFLINVLFTSKHAVAFLRYFRLFSIII